MPKGVYPHTHLKPKRYDADLVEQVAQRYGDGRTQQEIAQEFGLTQKVVWRLMKNHGIAARVAARREQSGPTNHAWRGDDAGYQALHLRVANLRGKPARCTSCGEDDPQKRYEWANQTGRYEDPADYVRMCLSCHRAYDIARRAATGELTSPVRRFR